ncbi:MAG: M48 family metallopeptidase [Ilumatobacteraceae bacterium]
MTAKRPHPFHIEVVRSKRRRRSVSAELVGTTLKVSIPAWMTQREEERSVDEMVRRFTRFVATTDIDLTERARALASRYRLAVPDHIEWANNLKAVWGLCTPEDRAIRISDRLVGFPSWVLDYVIVHELAHLEVSGHSQDFWKVVRRFPKTERAIGYLMAKSGSGSEDLEPGDVFEDGHVLEDGPEHGDGHGDTAVSGVPSGSGGDQLSLDLTNSVSSGQRTS